MNQWIFQIRYLREIETILISYILEEMIFLLKKETKIDFARKFISALYTLVKTLSKDIVFFLVSLNFVLWYYLNKQIFILEKPLNEMLYKSFFLCMCFFFFFSLLCICILKLAYSTHSQINL